MTDAELLELITSYKYSERLSEAQREAFGEMLDRGDPLSKAQRRWLYGVAERLGIQIAPAENIFSEMPPAKRAEHSALATTKLPWERPGYVKATKPPGVSR